MITEAEMVKLREEYLALATCTDPIDRPRAEGAFARAYKLVGCDPVPVLWVDSPLSAMMAIGLLEYAASLDPLHHDPNDVLSYANVSAAVMRRGTHSIVQIARSLDRLSASLRQIVAEQSPFKLRRVALQPILRAYIVEARSKFARAVLRGPAFEFYRDHARSIDGYSNRWEENVVAALGETLKLGVWRHVRESVAPMGGPHDVVCVLYRYAVQNGLHDTVKCLDILDEIARSGGWWYPRVGMVIACERPCSISLNDQWRLHNDRAPAVIFRDGWKIYAINGRTVPDWIVEHPEQITLDRIETADDRQLSRIMIRQMGWQHLVPESIVLDHDERFGTLYRWIRDPSIVFVEVVNGTPEPDGTFRHHFLPVAPHCEPLPDPAKPNTRLGRPQALTARNAVASTHGLTGDQLEGLVLRT